MATTIRELLTKIGVEVDDRQLKELDKSIGAFKTSMGALAKYAAGVAAVLGGVTVTSALAGNAAAKAGDRVGLTAERFQELAFAAGQADVKTEQLEQALRFGNVQLAEAAKGSSSAAERFAELGISIRDADGNLKTIDQVLGDVADALGDVEDPALLGAKAARVFGEEAGPRLVPLLKQGSAGIAVLSARAREFGKVIDEDTARASEAFFDRLDDLKAISLGLRNAFAARLIPTLTRLFETLVRLQLASRKLVAERLEVWGDRLARAVEVVRRVLLNTTRALEAVGAGAKWVDLLAWSVVGLGAALGAAALISGVGVLRALFALIQTVGVKAILKWVAANVLLFAQFALVTGAFVLAGLAIDDFLTFLRGGDSVIGRFLKSIGMADEVRAVLVEFGKEGKAAIQPLFDLLADLFGLDDEEGDGGTFLDSWITGMKELKPFVEATVTGLRELLRLWREWNERNDNGGTGAERDIKNKTNDEAAVRAALERRAAREGITVAELQARRAAGGAERRIAGATASAVSSSSSSVDRSRNVTMGDTSITINGAAGGDAEASARRILDDQARRVREDLVVGGEA